MKGRTQRPPVPARLCKMPRSVLDENFFRPCECNGLEKYCPDTSLDVASECCPAKSLGL